MSADRNVTRAALKMRRYRVRQKAELAALRAAVSAAGLQRGRLEDGQIGHVPNRKPQQAAPIVGLPRDRIEQMARRAIASGQAQPAIAYTMAQAPVSLLGQLPNDVDVIELS